MGSFKLKGLEGSENLKLVLPSALEGRRAYYHNLVAATRKAAVEEAAVPTSAPAAPSAGDLDAIRKLLAIASRLEALGLGGGAGSSASPVAEGAATLELAVSRIEAAVGTLWFQKLGSYTQRIQQLLSRGSGKTPHFSRSEDPASMMAALEFALSNIGGGSA